MTGSVVRTGLVLTLITAGCITPETHTGVEKIDELAMRIADLERAASELDGRANALEQGQPADTFFLIEPLSTQPLDPSQMNLSFTFLPDSTTSTLYRGDHIIHDRDEPSPVRPKWWPGNDLLTEDAIRVLEEIGN